MVVNVDNTNYDKEVASHKGLIIIDFWAPWCGACQMSSPIVEQISKEAEKKVKIVKINVDESQDIASKFGVMSIPSFIFLKNQNELKRVVGLQTKKYILDIINEVSGE